MSPNPESSTFVFDTQAWTSMTSQMSYMNMATAAAQMMAAEANSNLGGGGSWDAVAVAKEGARDRECPPKRVNSNPNLSTMRRCGRRSSLPRQLPSRRHEDLSISQENNAKVSPLRERKLSRSKSAPRKKSNGSSNSNDSNNRDNAERRSSLKVGPTRSKSFTAPSKKSNIINNNDINKRGDSANNKNDAKNRRRQSISGLAHKHKKKQLHRESSFHSMSEPIIMCTVHPQVRMRSDRCPRCAAGEMKKQLSFRKILEKKDDSMASIVGGTTKQARTKLSRKMEKKFGRNQHHQQGAKQYCRDSQSVNSRGEGVMAAGRMNYPTAADETTASSSVESPEMMDLEDEDVEIEEVSLDAKWADALREISKRLANEKSQHNEEKEKGGERRCLEEENTAASCKPPLKKYHSLKTLSELHQTIERATKSIGKFSVESDDDDGDDDCDTIYSESSLARDTPSYANKIFAESKGGQQTPLPHHRSRDPHHLYPQGCLQPQQHHYREDPLSQGLGSFATSLKFEGTDVTTSTHSCHSSGSESSMTLSVGSEYTMESYNSLAANTTVSYNSLSAPGGGGGVWGRPDPPTSSLKSTSPMVETASSNETHVSPTCVMDNKALDGDDEDYSNYEEEEFNYYDDDEQSNYEDYHDGDYRSRYEQESMYKDEPGHEDYHHGNYEEEKEALRDADEMEEEDQEVFENSLFQNSFFMAVPKDYSEKKMATPAVGNYASNVREYNDTTGHRGMSHDSLPTNVNFVPVVSGQPEGTHLQEQRYAPTKSNAQVLLEDVTSDESDIEGEIPPPNNLPSEPMQERMSSSHSTTETSQTCPSMNTTQILVEDVTSDESVDSSEAAASVTVSSSPAKKTVASSRGKTTSAKTGASPPSKAAKPSFFSALVHNSRSRSCSRSRARSRSRSKSAARQRKLDPKDDKKCLKGKKNGHMIEKERSVSFEASMTKEAELEEVQKSQPVPQQPDLTKKMSEEPPQSEAPPVSKPKLVAAPCFASPERGPITHPHYKLGDLARDEDMIVFPKTTKSSHRSSRRRRRRKDDSSSSSDSDEEDEEVQSRRKTANILLAIGQLRHLDAAFVRRSDGRWTYALVADGDDTQIRFVVNDKGSTKSFPESIWKSSIRRIRVLTPREGDRFALNNGGKSSRKKRSIGRSRGRSRGSKGSRLVSPSPTRRSAGVMNLPPTIMEDREYNNPSRAYI